jgi:hypothetical protein
MKVIMHGLSDPCTVCRMCSLKKPRKKNEIQYLYLKEDFVGFSDLLFKTNKYVLTIHRTLIW